jgi:hypothetical protein
MILVGFQNSEKQAFHLKGQIVHRNVRFQQLQEGQVRANMGRSKKSQWSHHPKIGKGYKKEIRVWQ